MMVLAFAFEVHEQDIVTHYVILREYLLEFSHARLPDLETHKAPQLQDPQHESWQFGFALSYKCISQIEHKNIVSNKAAMALLAISVNIFPDELYNRRGGKGKVKEPQASSIVSIPTWAS